MMKSLYYPIDSQNLFFVLSHGCICPACLYGERLDDVQSRNQTYVLLTEGKKIPAESNVRIEIKVTDSERSSMLKSGKFLLYSGIIPISRIVSITSRDNINNVRTLIEANTAYLPNRLLRRAEKTICSNDQVEHVDNNPKMEEVARLKAQYDKGLGGMALAAIAGRRDMRMSLNFVMYLACFNPLVMDILAENKVEFKSPFDNSSYKAVNSYIKQYSIISKDTVREAAATEGQVIPRIGITKKEDFSGLTGAPYLFFILYNYKANDLDNDGNGTDKIDSLICKRFDGVKEMELSAYCYGRHRGYVVLRKAYGDVPCKFKLDNYVDYIIIESIFKMVCKEHPESAYYTSFLKEVTNAIPTPSDIVIDDDAFSVFGYSVKKPDPIQYPSAKWFCRFFEQQRSEQEIAQEYERLVAFFNRDKVQSEGNVDLIRKLNEDLRDAILKIKMLEDGVRLDERVIDEKDRQIRQLSSDNESLHISVESLRRKFEEQQSHQLDDIPPVICEPQQDNSAEIALLKSRIAELKEENFQFSKKIDELKKNEKTQAPEGYLDLGIDYKEQKEMSEIKSIINRAFELYGKQNAVLAALVKEKYSYANDREDKKSLITKLILIEKGLLHD